MKADADPKANSSVYTRRELLGAGAGVVSLVVIGCAGKLPPAHEVQAEGGEVAIALADAPELAQPDGVMTLEVAGVKKPVLLVRDGDNYEALLLKCTHMGCTPGWNAAERRLDCPCHGSRFDAHGAVLKGPAKQPLEKYAVTSDGTTLRFRVA
ncbi:QcrA and Rieske domain-containing protein [Nannocystis punicea]|uniref:Ubiquinol-cytochrome c reductase iron-sulfur subunit n=1 Tax=Nannocystis punicea TaxID=2995304 RepID=A0ABY7HHF1_9BACT|nr:ubiquinol-cytochrome c reductase iron-sulfur subunit [Nannocystis poenicansa]WAS98730.1 ubiquinol-cytochrome c reductase iron-sulfur subunit [Nannocystis poenicansa]